MIVFLTGSLVCDHWHDSSDICRDITILNLRWVVTIVSWPVSHSSVHLPDIYILRTYNSRPALWQGQSFRLLYNQNMLVGKVCGCQLLVLKIIGFGFDRKPCALVSNSSYMSTELLHITYPTADEISVQVWHGVYHQMHMKPGTLSVFGMCTVHILISSKEARDPGT